MTLTTQHLEELLRLALTENERLRLESQCIKSSVAEDTEHLRKRLARAEEDLGKTYGRLYMDPDERTALARDLAEAHVTLGLAAETLRSRNKAESNRCERLFNRMGEWVKKMKVSP